MSGGKSGGFKSYLYYGSFAASWHVGQMDKLTGVIINDKLVWTGPLTRAASTNPVEITVPNRGIYRHYWGTRDQLTVDTILQSAGNDQGHSHPARTGICYGVFDDFLLGKEVQNVPSISIRGERAPVQSLITGSATALVNSQANPFVVLAELMTDEWFGLAMPLAFFSASAWQAAADLAIPKAALCYVSPFYDSQQSVRAIAANLFALCDGFLRAETGTGLCEAGMFTTPEEVDLGSLLTISQRMRLADPQVTPQTWDDIETTWNIRFRDRDYNFKERSITHDDPGALARVGDVRPVDLDRKEIVLATQALNHAREWGRRHSTPGLAGVQRVRSETITTLRPGTHALIDVQVEPDAAADTRLCRVLGVDRTIKDGSEIKFEAVRSSAVVATGTIIPPDPPADTAIPCIDVTFRAISLPREADQDVQLAVLAERPAALVTSFAAYYDPALAGPYQRLGSSRGWALRCQLTAAIAAADPGALSVTILGDLDRTLVQDNPGDTGAADDEILVVVLKLSGDNVALDGDDLAYMEIMSASEFTIGVGDALDITALRSRRKTTAHDFDIGDEVWIMRRSALTIFTSGNFSDEATGYIRLEPATSSTSQPDCDAETRIMRRPPSGDPDYRDLLILLLTPGLECRALGGTATLCGVEEYTSPSTPPKKFLEEKLSGEICNQYYWPNSGACDQPCRNAIRTVYSGSRVFDPDTCVETDNRIATIYATSGDGSGPDRCCALAPYSSTAGGTAVGTLDTETRTTRHFDADTACIYQPSYFSYYSKDVQTTGGTDTELLNEDTEENAFARLIASLGDWPDDDTGWITAGSISCGDLLCCTAYWQDRTTGFSIAYQKSQFRVSIPTLEADTTYYVEVDMYRRAYGTSDDWVLFSTEVYLPDSDGTGLLQFIGDVPNARGYETRAQEARVYE